MSSPWLCIMRIASSWTLILMLGAVKGAAGAEQSAGGYNPPTSPNNGDLFLTDLIDNNKTKEVRNKSRVLEFLLFGVDAFSGFITINKSTKSNLFFLLTEAQNNRDDAPLLLWTQGGPGQSALFGQFLENGPVAFDYTKNESFPFTPRNNTLQKNMSIIYLDLPFGAGFSFTENKTAYSKSLEEISDSVMEFLKQFLKLFPSYECRDFYVAGESYGARYSVAIADALISNKHNVLLKLKGIISGNGFLGPILETADSSDFLYWTSMLNETGRQNLSDKFQLMRNMSETKKIFDSTYVIADNICRCNRKEQNLVSKPHFL
uniref:Putative serine carboxypeptidase n=1 Tax=Rhipicephalus microplus TaxID=6941 RepID=A0A6G5A0H0_RHIMP